MLIKRLFLLLLLSLLLTNPVSAQAVEYPMYVVQFGDSLNSIAALFGTTTDEIIQLNNISDPDFISEGTPLLIPGLDGISGELRKVTISIGETYFSIVKNGNLPENEFVRINRITSPNEIHLGGTIILAELSQDQFLSPYFTIPSGTTLLESAAILNKSQNSLIQHNHLMGTWDYLDNQVLYSFKRDITTSLFPINSPVQEISISSLPIMQGKTIVIRIKTTKPLSITGSLNDHSLNFVSIGENEYIALQGIHRQADPGLTNFNISANDASGEVFKYQQDTLLVADYFLQDNMLYVDPRLMDPAITEPEDQLVISLTNPVTQNRFWDGYFYKPLDSIDCTSSVFGSIRAYNDSAYIYSHSGSDFGVCSNNNLNIYAVASGIVVFSDFLDVRGNSVIIDHGWGVYSGYWHQSERMVKKGDQVEAGQIIGQVGTTGRSNGAHLHLEIWVGGVQVEPMDWLTRQYP